MSAPAASNTPAQPTSNAEPVTQTTATNGWSGKKIAILIVIILVILAVVFGVVYAYRKPSSANTLVRQGNAGTNLRLNQGSTVAPPVNARV